MNQTSDDSLFARLNKPGVIVVLLFGLVTAVSLTALRTYRSYSPPDRQFDWSTRGHSDFHNGTYFPTMAFRDGVIPYSEAATEAYPIARASPIYSPAVFIWHLPFTFLKIHQADVAYFAFNTTLMGLLAWLGITLSGRPFRMGVWLLLFTAVVISRPGHMTLFTGYFTAELVVGTMVALHFARSRPLISGLGMFLASGKPTYAIPLILLMLCRRNFRAVAIGVAICIAAGLIGLGWLATFSSPAEVLSGVNEGRVALHNEPEEDPVNTWTRLDTVGAVSKVMGWKPGDDVYLISMLVLLLIPGWAVYRASSCEKNHGATGLSALIVCLAILVSIYHHSYDSLLIAVPWIGLAFFRSIDSHEMPAWIRWTIVCLLAVPAANYCSTLTFQQYFDLNLQGTTWKMVASANGLCLFLALVLSIWCSLRPRRQVHVA